MADKAFRAATSNLIGGSYGGPRDLYERFVAAEWDIDKALRSYTPLPRDTQIRFDNVVVETFQSRLRVAKRLIDLGLVYTVDNPFRVSEVEYNKDDDATGSGVERTMSPIPRLDSEKPDLAPEKVPVYFTSAMFMLDMRDIETSQAKGTPIDVSIAARKVRAIVKDIEDAIINGGTLKIAGNQGKGFLDAPDLQTLEVGDSWDASGKTGAQILKDMTDAIDLARGKQVHGPFDLVLAPKWFNALARDYVTNYPKTILNRLLEIQAGGEPVFIYEADMMPADTGILYPRDVDNVRLIMANMGGSPASQPNSPEEPTFTPISLFPWESVGGFVKNWLVSTVVIPNMRSTSTGQTGIVRIVNEVS